MYAHDYAEKMKGRLASFSPTLCSNPLEYIASLESTHRLRMQHSSLCSAMLVLCRIRCVVILHTTTAIDPVNQNWNLEQNTAFKIGHC